MKSEMKLTPMARQAVIARAAADAEVDMYEISFSSEEPYERWWGIEILGHKKGEVDLSWMESGRAPLLVDHEVRVDSTVGVVSKAWIEEGRAKALVRFGQGARAQEIKARVDAGELTNISVGYRIEEMQLVKCEKNGPSTYRATKWKPHEVSLVAVPADPTVGVGRAGAGPEYAVRIFSPDEPNPPARSPAMEPTTITQPAAPAAPALSADEILAAERKRMSELESLGARFNNAALAREHIGKGTSVEMFRGVLLDAVGADTYSRVTENANKLGLSQKEARQFSFTRLIASAMDAQGNAALREAAKFEIEVCAAEGKRAMKADRKMRGNTFSVPVDVLRTPLVDGQRDLTSGTNSAGGYTVAANLMSQDFISLLRNRMMTQRMGARVLNGLEGSIAIPRQSAGATFYWVAESGAPTESQQTFEQVTLTPTTGGAFTDFSRRLMLQSSLDVEMLVRDDLANVIALGVDLAALHGTGSSNQPTGIAATSGINTVALGTNGLAPTWASIVQMETEVSTDNADIGNLGYLTNAKVRGKLKGVEKFSSTGQTVWETGIGDNSGFGMMNGYKAGVSNQVSSTLTKGSSSGVCSAIFYGNWADLLIGFWSGIDILVDPYTGGTAGTVRVIGLQDVDVAVRHPESFCYIADALTT